MLQYIPDIIKYHKLSKPINNRKYTKKLFT